MQDIYDIDVVKLKISNSLIELILKRDYHSISIIDIMKDAGMSRSTFYRHFSSKDDVINYCFDGIVLRFYHSIPSDFSTLEGYREAVKHVFRTIKHHKRILKAIIDSGCAYIIQNYIDEQYAKGFQKNGEPSTLLPYIYSGALGNVIIRWVKADCETSIDEVADAIVDTTHPAIYGGKY
ncbi:MAG: TetR/AcrR family transcriptional regulator [Clostridia bacterium]|nr:TetR/AcrR family transcriptional regulator [Clostridia bacterium]